jgi:ribulose 1,5-bisphosphate synthetase/thiazole synthase
MLQSLDLHYYLIEAFRMGRSTMATTHYPVLIVGAGAAGLTASTLLAHHGVRSLTIEKRKEIFSPEASCPKLARS